MMKMRDLVDEGWDMVEFIFGDAKWERFFGETYDWTST